MVLESGQWAVYLVILSPTGVRRSRVQTHFTKQKALLAADVIRRTAARRRPPKEGIDD